jgi:hypothetical protein
MQKTNLRWTIASSTLLGALGLTVALIAQAAQPDPGTGGPAARMQGPASVSPPCCAVTAIDVRDGVVVARETATGRTFQFRAPQNLLPQIRLGQKMWVDARTQVVSLEGAPNCCKLVQQATGTGVVGSPAQSSTKDTKSAKAEVKVPSGLPNPTASEGTTAGAIRGRPETPGTRPGRLGLVSPASENEDGEPDPAPRAALSTAATTKAFNRATAKHVKDLQDVQKFFASLGHEVEKLNINVALIGGNKYMVNDCLGIKASAGQFTFRPGAPSLRLDGSGVLMQFVVNRVALDGLSVRVRPNASNPTKLCHFSKRFGVGGSASNVRFEIRFDPLLDLRECKVQTVGQIRYSLAIGGFNLKPLQNDLDKVAKNMIEEAINLFLEGPTHKELMWQATALALKTTCTGGV